MPKTPNATLWFLPCFLRCLQRYLPANDNSRCGHGDAEANAEDGDIADVELMKLTREGHEEAA